MKNIRRLLFALLFGCFIPALSYGQGIFIPPRVVTGTVNGITRPIPNATVTVCGPNSPGTPCTPPLANTVFKDQGLTVPLSNPFQTDSNGNYPQAALAGGTYTITESAPGFTGFSYQATVSCAPGAPCTITGPFTVTGALTTKSVVTELYVDSANAAGWAGADWAAWVNSALAFCPSTSDCIIHVSGFSGTVAGTGNTIAITRPVKLIFTNARFVYNGAGTFITCNGADGVIIEGVGSRGGGGSLQGTVLQVSSTTSTGGINATNCGGFNVTDLFLNGPGGGTQNGLTVNGGNQAMLSRLNVNGWGNDGVLIDGRTNNSNSGIAENVVASFNGNVGFQFLGSGAGNCNNWTLNNTTAGTNVKGYDFNICGFETFVSALSQFSTGHVGFSFESSVGNAGSIYSEPNLGGETSSVTFDGNSNANTIVIQNGVSVTDNGNGNAWTFGNPVPPAGLSPNIWRIYETQGNNDTAFNPIMRFSRRQQTTDPCDLGLWLKSASTITGLMFDCQNAFNIRYNDQGGSAGVNFWNNIADGSIATTNPTLSVDGVMGSGVGINGALRLPAGSVGTGKVLISPTAPTIAAAGCGGAAASIVVANGTAAFKVNVGTTPTSACTLTFPAATTGWNVTCNDITTQSTSVFVQKQTGAESTTSVTITNFNDVAVATAFVASDILKCTAAAD